MNKKEITSLRKNFNEESGFFVINNVLSAFVDAKKNVVSKDVKLFGVIPEDDKELILETLKKGISGTLGKNLMEYSFPKAMYEETGSQSILYKVYKGKLSESEYNERLLDRITENINYNQAFTVFVAHCTYTLFTKDKNDEKTDNTTDYDFLLTVICPVTYCDDSLMVDKDSNKICKRPKSDRLVAKGPTDAILFPVLTDGEPDINQVLCYTSKPKEPNRSVVENVLGCSFRMTAEGEKIAFAQILTEAIGEDLDYTIITQLNEKIEDSISKQPNTAGPATINNDKLCAILEKVGVNDEKIEEVANLYEDIVGDNELTATNLIESKTIINTADVTITVRKTGTDKVRVATVGGRKCLVVDIDENSIDVNGISTTV